MQVEDLKILILCSKYNHKDSSPWLISELAEYLSLSHQVFVLCLDWSSPQKKNINLQLTNGSLDVVFIPTFCPDFLPSSISLLLKWTFSSIIPLFHLVGLLISHRKFDLSLSNSPCSALWASLPLLKLISKRNKLIYWDFFPIHNFQIRSAPNFIIPPLKLLESNLVNLFDSIGCMSPACVEFFHLYFTSIAKSKVSVVPIWSSVDYRSSSLVSDDLVCPDKINFIFGGQLTHGRDLLELCQSFIHASQFNPKITLNICGTGPLLDQILYLSHNHKSLNYLGQFPRSVYLSLLKSCDVGVISILTKGTAPAYPSKSLDYMASSLPILAFTDSFSDFSSVVNQESLGIAVNSGVSSEKVDAILRLADSSEFRARLGSNALEYFLNNHSTASVAEDILR